MRLGYARVSTDDQNLAPQTDALRAAGCTQVFSDQGVCGAQVDRDGLAEAMAALKPGDVLVVWKLDRLGRSLRFVIELIDRLESMGCGFASLTEGFDTTTNTGRLVFHILAAIGEFERGLISERTRSGLEAARREGKKIGPRFLLDTDAIIEAHRLVTMDERPITDVARDLNVSYDTLRRSFRRSGLVA